MRPYALTSSLILGLTLFLVFTSKQARTENDKRKIWSGANSVYLNERAVPFKISGETHGVPVLLLQSYDDPPSLWDPMVPALVQHGFRTYQFGLRMMRTENTEKAYRDQLIEVIRALKIDAPFHIVGFGEGAIIAADFVKNFPTLVKKVTFIGVEDKKQKGQKVQDWMQSAPIIKRFLKSSLKIENGHLSKSIFLKQAGQTHKMAMMLWGQSQKELSQLNASPFEKARRREFKIIEGMAPIESLSRSSVMKQFIQNLVIN